MTRLDWCEWRPGPLERRGYGGVTSLPLGRKEGEVKHSTEGSLAAALGVFTDPTRQASWHFTLPKQGPIRAYQHYELEDITWHCGLPGDERHDTSLIGNITLIGEEHEGRAGEPLTAWQVENSIALSRDIRALCPAIGVPELRKNFWEHGWLSGTACPSGRIPWNAIIAALQTPVEEEDVPKMRFVKGATGPVWVTDGVFKMGIVADQIRIDLENLGLAEPGVQPVADEFITWLIDPDLIENGAVRAAMGAPAVSAAAVIDELKSRL